MYGDIYVCMYVCMYDHALTESLCEINAPVTGLWLGMQIVYVKLLVIRKFNENILSITYVYVYCGEGVVHFLNI